MSKFLTVLEVVPSADERTFEIMSPLVYESDLVGDVTVPMGFETDFASVPRALWSILPPFGMYGEAAVVHDYLYSTQHFARATADAVLMEAMESSGVAWLTRRTIYCMVRLFGWHAWRQHQRENAK